VKKKGFSREKLWSRTGEKEGKTGECMQEGKGKGKCDVNFWGEKQKRGVGETRGTRTTNGVKEEWLKKGSRTRKSGGGEKPQQGKGREIGTGLGKFGEN